MIFKNNKTYDTLSLISRIILPLSVLITTLGDIWGIPYAIQISATLCAVDVFLGSVLISSKKKYDEMNESDDN